jgi:type I restriction enzyme S subunit
MKTTGNEAKFDSQIPSSWISCFVDDIAMKVTDGEHITPERSKSGHFLLSARNVTNDGIELSDVDFVPESEFLRIRKRCDPGKGDILISCSGSVGRVAVVDRDDAYTMVRSAALIKLDSSRINSEYVAFALRADRYNGRFWRTRSQRPRLISSSARFAGFAFLYHPSRNNAA